MSGDFDGADPVVQALLLKLDEFDISPEYRCAALVSTWEAVHGLDELEAKLSKDAECVLTMGGLVKIRERDSGRAFFGEES